MHLKLSDQEDAAPFQAHVAVWPRNEGGFWWTVKTMVQPTAARSEGGWETTRLKAWRHACRVARSDFGPTG
jgi:hypothetical protein